jgi:hypothetical protein
MEPGLVQCASMEPSHPKLFVATPPHHKHTQLHSAKCTRSLDHHILKVQIIFFVFCLFSRHTQYARSDSAHTHYKQSLTL